MNGWKPNMFCSSNLRLFGRPVNVTVYQFLEGYSMIPHFIIFRSDLGKTKEPDWGRDETRPHIRSETPESLGSGEETWDDNRRETGQARLRLKDG